MNNLVEYKGTRVTLMACSKCNVACTHCYIGYEGNRDPEDLAALTQQFVSEGKHVRIDGAEVLTDLGYLKSYKIAGQNWIMSNGLRIFREPEIIDIMKEYGIDTVYMSYHFGIQEEINLIDNDILNKVIELLLAKDINVYINTTITNKNVSDIMKMCEIAYSKGAKGIGFGKIFSQGNATNIKELDLSQDELNNFFRDLQIARSKYDKNDFYITRGGSFGKDTIRGKDNFRCNAGIGKIMITPDNNVYSCNSMCSTGYEIGKYFNGIIYINSNFSHDCSFCLSEVLGNLNIKDISEVNLENSSKLIKKYKERLR